MMAINRVNRQGHQFKLTEVFGEPDRVQIKLGDKMMIVHATIKEMDRAWYKWQIKGDFAQDAFHFLTPEAREFLISGISPNEWNDLFGDIIKNGNSGPTV